MRAGRFVRWVKVRLGALGVVVTVAASVSVASFSYGQTPGQPSPTTAPAKRIHEMTEAELGQYVAWLHQAKPTPAARVAEAALRSLGQPYRLGAPMLCHRESDCVTFVEHTLAMAMATSWESYVRMVARLRHADYANLSGAYGVVDGRLVPENRANEGLAFLDRNHFTLLQWVPNNTWALTDVTAQAGGTGTFSHVAYPKWFYRELSFTPADAQSAQVMADRRAAKIESVPRKSVSTQTFIRRDDVAGSLSRLQTSDVVLIIREYKLPSGNTLLDCDHMGILVERTPWDAADRDGPPSLIHASAPKVQRESLVRFMRRFPRVQGLKILRLRADVEQAATREDAAVGARMSLPPARSQ